MNRLESLLLVGLAAAVGVILFLSQAPSPDEPAPPAPEAPSAPDAELRQNDVPAPERAAPEAPLPMPAAPVATASADSSALRIRALEEEVARLRAALARFEGIDDEALVLYGGGTLAERLLAVLGLPENRHAKVLGALAKSIPLEELFALLRETDDPVLLGLAGRVLAAARMPEERWDELLALLAGGRTAAHRLAAARALPSKLRWNSEARERYWPVVASALRSETDPVVIQGLCERLNSFGPQLFDDMIGAVEAALPRLPAGEPRRAAYTTLFWGDLERSSLEGQLVLFRDARAQDERDDIAHAVGSLLLRIGKSPAPGDEERFFEIYAGTSDEGLRRRLVRGTQTELIPWDAHGAEVLRRLAELEPLPETRATLLAFADACAKGEIKSTSQVEDYLKP